VLECVVNVSEGADRRVLGELAAAVADDLLDIHIDENHNRSVFTLVGEQAPRNLTRRAFELLDITTHTGVHPRLGIIDVVPFVPLAGSTWDDAVTARDRFAHWVVDEFAIPAFLYGPERTLPYVRQHAFVDLDPDVGPLEPHPHAGAVCVGARDALVAYNVWLRDCDVTAARKIAAAIRGSSLRALGLQVGDRVQVSMNLINPMELGPFQAFDAVSELTQTEGAELVGLIPQAVLDAIPPSRWKQLDVSSEQTIEFRLAERARRRN
jgi:glutamate formiminotransferase